MKKIILGALFIAILSGCSTGYHPSGFGGGYNEFKVADDKYLISFQGNGYTSGQTANIYALRRAAELTKEKGYQYFVIENSATTVSESAYRTPVQAHTTSSYNGSDYGTVGYNGNYSGYSNVTENSTTTYTGGNLIVKQRPHASMMIQMYNTPVPASLNADAILSNFKK